MPSLNSDDLQKLLSATPEHNLAKDIWRGDLGNDFVAGNMSFGAYLVTLTNEKLTAILGNTLIDGKSISPPGQEDQKITFFKDNFGEGITTPAFIAGDDEGTKENNFRRAQELLIKSWILSSLQLKIDEKATTDIDKVIQLYTQDFPSLTHKGMGEKSQAIVKALPLSDDGWKLANVNFDKWKVSFVCTDGKLKVQIDVWPTLETSDLRIISNGKAKTREFPMGKASYSFNIENGGLKLINATCDNETLAHLINGTKNLKNDPAETKHAYYQVVKEQLQNDAAKTNQERVDRLLLLAKEFAIAADLSNMDLQSVNLSMQDLTQSNLTGANLTGANLTDANLTGAVLTKANLSSAIFEESQLRTAMEITDVVRPIDIGKINALRSPEKADELDIQVPGVADKQEEKLSQLTHDLFRSMESEKSSQSYIAGTQSFANFLNPQNISMPLTNEEKNQLAKKWLRQNTNANDADVDAMLKSYRQNLAYLINEAINTYSHADMSNLHQEAVYHFNINNHGNLAVKIEQKIYFKLNQEKVFIGDISTTVALQPKTFTDTSGAAAAPPTSAQYEFKVTDASCSNAVLSDLMNGRKQLSTDNEDFAVPGNANAAYYRAHVLESSIKEDDTLQAVKREVIAELLKYTASRGKESQSGFKLNFFRKAPWHDESLTKEKINAAKELISLVSAAEDRLGVKLVVNELAKQRKDSALTKSRTPLAVSDYALCLEKCADTLEDAKYIELTEKGNQFRA